MIKLENVYKFYYRNQVHKVILDHVSAEFERGYSYGILGMNGAGKSTLVRLLAGAELPNAGRIRRSARISWPLAFSGGLHTGQTARENVRFVARAYGENVQRVVRFVEDFAEVGQHFDMPVGVYSSGMRARVAFGLSLAIRFDCYLIDETMSVGDARFRQRCEQEFAARRKQSDIIMVSHSIGRVRQYCDRAFVLAGGKLYPFNNLDQGIDYYLLLNQTSPVGSSSRQAPTGATRLSAKTNEIALP